MHEDSEEDSKRRVDAWRVIREARQAIEGMLDEAARTNNSHSMYAKLKKWLPVITATENHVGNLIGELDLMMCAEIRPIAAKLRQIGQRKTDEISDKLERAYAMLMNY